MIAKSADIAATPRLLVGEPKPCAALDRPHPLRPLFETRRVRGAGVGRGAVRLPPDRGRHAAVRRGRLGRRGGAAQLLDPSAAQLERADTAAARDVPALRLQHRSRRRSPARSARKRCVIRSISSITAAIPMPATTARTTSSHCAASRAGEEIRMDYGTFSFSFDHEFDCRCGAPWCRGRVHRQ